MKKDLLIRILIRINKDAVISEMLRIYGITKNVFCFQGPPHYS